MRSLKALILAQLIVLGVLASASAHAAIVCEGKTRLGSMLRLTLAANGSALVEILGEGGAVEHKTEFAKTDEVWDGHMTGLVTAPGLSVKYENWYGCIHKAVITTDVRGEPGYIDVVSVETCRGGTTSDRICMPH